MINVLQAMIITTKKDGSDADLLRYKMYLPFQDSLCPSVFRGRNVHPAKSLCRALTLSQQDKAGKLCWN